MEVRSVFTDLRSAVNVLKLMTVFALIVSLDGLKQNIEITEGLTTSDVSTQASLKCTLQSTPRLPAFSMNGDFVIGGVFSIHYQMHVVISNYTTKPEPSRCAGR